MSWRSCEFDDDKYDAWLSRIESKIDGMVKQINRTAASVQALTGVVQHVETDMSAIDDAIAALTTQVQANTDAESAASALISQLAGLIQSNANDPAAVADLAAKLKASADALAAAVTANTPAA